MRTGKLSCIGVASVLGTLLLWSVGSSDTPNEPSMSPASTPAVLRLASIAYEDFTKRLKENRRGDSAVEVYISDIDNYQITISVENGTCVVDFVPKPMKGGGTWRGGGSRYVVDAKTGKILKYTADR